MTWQGNHGLFITIPTDIKKMVEKLQWYFFSSKKSKKYPKQLLCTGEAINVYGKFEKKLILNWPLCESSDIVLVLPKLKECLKKFRKQLVATFYLIKKICRAKNKNEKPVKFLINSTQKDLIYLLKTKICKKKFLMTKKYLA